MGNSERFIKSFFILFFLSLSISSLAQQEESDTTAVSWDWYLLIQQDGKRYFGQLLSDDGQEIIFFTKILGELHIPKKDIKHLKRVDKRNYNDRAHFLPSGAISNTYYLTDNAYSIKKNEKFIQLNLWGANFEYGLTNRFSIGIKSSYLLSPILLRGVYKLKLNDNLRLAFGGYVGSSGFFNSFRGYLFSPYFQSTVGNHVWNGTVSISLFSAQIGNKSRQFDENGYFTFPSNQVLAFLPKERIETPHKGICISLASKFKTGKWSSLNVEGLWTHSRFSKQIYEEGVIKLDSFDTNGNYYPGEHFIRIFQKEYQENNFLINIHWRIQKNELRAYQLGFNFLYYRKKIYPFPSLSLLYKIR